MFLAVATVPLLLVGVLTFHNYRDALEANHLSQLQNIAAYKADKIETYFADLKADMEIARGFLSVRQCLPVLDRFATEPNNPEFIAVKESLDEALPPRQSILKLVDIMLTDTQGRVVYSSNPEHFAKYFLGPLPDPEQRSFKRGKNAIYVTDVFFNKAEDNRLAMLVSAPVSDFNDAFIGVIVFEVDMTPVYKLIQDTTGLGNTGETLVGKKIGNEAVFLNPLRHDPNAALVRKIKLGDEIGVAIQQAVQNKEGAGQYIDYRGKKVIGAWRYIPSLDWGMVAKIDSEEAFADVTNLRNLVAIILGIVIVLSCITALSIAQSISVPIKRLSEGAQIIGSGNLDYKIGTNRKDEIGQLSRTFDKMTSDLKQTVASRDELSIEVRERKKTEQVLRESREDLDRAQSVGNIGSWRLDVRKNKLTWSDENHRIFGIPKGTPMTYETFLSTVHPDDRQYVDAKWKAGLSGENYDVEHRIVVGSQIKWVREKAYLEFDDKGALLGGFGITQDITERKHAAEQLEMVARFPSENPSPVLRIASDGMILYSNGPGLSLLEEWGRGVGQEAPQDWCEQVALALDSGQNIVQEVTCGKRIVSLVAAPVVEGGYVNLYGRDVTKERKADQALQKAHAELEKKVQERTAEIVQTVEILREQVEQRMRAEEAAKAERKRLEDVLEMMPAYAVLLTPDYHVAYANRTFRDWFGDDNGQRCYEFLFNRKEPCETCETYTVLKTGKSHFWEWTGPNGRNYDIYDYPFTDTDGSPLIMEIGVDVTAHKQAQTALRSVSLYSRGLLEAALDPLVTISADGKITDVNKATELVTGLSREQLIGTSFLNYFTEPKNAKKGYEKVFAEGVVRDYPLTIRHIDGHTTDVLYNATVYKNDAGEVQGVFAAARDITEKKAAEAELDKYREHLEDLVKQRTEELARSNKDLEQFAYVASHDLQEPLRAVAGFVELLKRNLQSSLDGKTTEYMNFTVDGAVRMQSLISGLLEYSRVGTHGQRSEQTDAKAALEQAIANLRMSIKESGAEITTDDLPMVYFDGMQLSQLLQNLIGNAIKFRAERTPRIHIGAARLDDSWRFAVADNGIGIDPQYAERIFLLFQRLHSREKYSGTGIGLSICKKIVERHNGKIWVESKPGSGSTFYFTVPDKGETN